MDRTDMFKALLKLLDAPQSKPAQRVHASPNASKSGLVRGRHFCEWVPELDALRKAGQVAHLEELLLECVDATEREAQVKKWGVAPAYYERLAILYRKQGRRDDELAILRRYQAQNKSPGVMPGKLSGRLLKLEQQVVNIRNSATGSPREGK
jgi:hypothetical protein